MLGGAAALDRFKTPIAKMSELAADRDLPPSAGIKLFLAGDVMLGRGIDQVLPHPSDPSIYEPYMVSAEGYVALAESAHGPIPKPVDYSYVWGDALAALRQAQPDARIVNLETSITKSMRYARKEIHYRMNPENAACLTAAGIDCCALANNHVLDWGPAGLLETLETLAQAGIRGVGAGRNAAEASAPAILSANGKGRIVVFSFGTEDSGIPGEWAAGASEPGVNLLQDFSDRTLARVAALAQAARRPGDILVASMHWGANFGYAIPSEHKKFAHGLIEGGSFDVVFGHSSHHPLGIEVYQRKLILYGCGDFLNDYEGIGGYEEYRGDLTLMYLPVFSASTGDLLQLTMRPFQIRRFRLNSAAEEDARWLSQRLDRESARLGTRVRLASDGSLVASWA
ncbi:MAG TPA: CapA family protein [Stellaceae bacterium]|nr:CapA family protein [Stellaceae bacterium]